jgi:hypothetical protein
MVLHNSILCQAASLQSLGEAAIRRLSGQTGPPPKFWPHLTAANFRACLPATRLSYGFVCWKDCCRRMKQQKRYQLVFGWVLGQLPRECFSGRDLLEYRRMAPRLTVINFQLQQCWKSLCRIPASIPRGCAGSFIQLRMTKPTIISDHPCGQPSEACVFSRLSKLCILISCELLNMFFWKDTKGNRIYR